MDVCPAEQPELRATSGCHRLACHLADDFVFPPIVRPEGGERAAAREPEEDSSGEGRRPEADEPPPYGRSMKEALFGSRRKARLVPGSVGQGSHK